MERELIHDDLYDGVGYAYGMAGGRYLFQL